MRQSKKIINRLWEVEPDASWISCIAKCVPEIMSVLNVGR